MDQHTGIGWFGWVCSLTLAEYHLIAAVTAAVLTSIYMSIAIYKKIKE